MNKLFIDFFRPFSPGQITNILTIAMEMETYGVTAAEVSAACREYIRAEIGKQNEQVKTSVPSLEIKTQRPITTCPQCGSRVTISRVNISKCTHVGGDWKTSLMCSNVACRFTELSKKSLDDWRNKNVF